MLVECFRLFPVTNFGVGTVAGGTAAFACHPLDVIRTRFVGQGEPKVYITDSHYTLQWLTLSLSLSGVNLHRSIQLYLKLLS